MNKKTVILNIVFIMAAAALLLLPHGAMAQLTATANHDHISIDFFYHGSSVSVRGVSDPNTDLVIKIASPEGHQVMKEKGKVAGFLWMNVGTLKIEHAPMLYTVHSTKGLDEVLSREEQEKFGLGYSALQKHVELNPVKNEEEKAKWFNEFVHFKENQKLYETSTGKISLSNGDGNENYYILTQWPYQAPPGEYTVTVYAVRDKKVIETAMAKVMVEQVGIIKRLAGMAKDNGGLYGILSIVAALGAGFGVGLVFRKGGGAH